MMDTNFTIVMMDGTEATVVYPDRFGRENIFTGIREWNVDFVESLMNYQHYPLFVIGKWDTSWSAVSGIKFTGEFSKVLLWRPLSPGLQKIADERLEKDKTDSAEKYRKSKFITVAEFETLVKAVEDMKLVQDLLVRQLDILMEE
jgi:hypothetical protein